MPYRSPAEPPGLPWHPASLPVNGGAAGRQDTSPQIREGKWAEEEGNATALAGGLGCTNLHLITINAALQLLASLQPGPFLHSLSPPFSEAGKSQTGAEVLLPQCLLRRSTKFPVNN